MTTNQGNSVASVAASTSSEQRLKRLCLYVRQQWTASQTQHVKTD